MAVAYARNILVPENDLSVDALVEHVSAFTRQVYDVERLRRGGRYGVRLTSDDAVVEVLPRTETTRQLGGLERASRPVQDHSYRIRIEADDDLADALAAAVLGFYERQAKSREGIERRGSQGALQRRACASPGSRAGIRADRSCREAEPAAERRMEILSEQQRELREQRLQLEVGVAALHHPELGLAARLDQLELLPVLDALELPDGLLELLDHVEA